MIEVGKRKLYYYQNGIRNI